MKILTCEQRSPEWFAARLGIPTASGFDRILTPKECKPTQAKGYMHELLSEWLTGVPHGSEKVSGFMERGIALEPQAIKWYEYEHGIEVQPVGCVLRDDGMVGSSPDGLVGEDGGVEIKCPGAVAHVRAMLEGMSGYTCQVQGTLWLTGRKWWDLVSYHPELQPIVSRIHRDDVFISALEQEVEHFLTKLMRAREALLALGCVPRALRLTPAIAEPEPF